MQSRVVITCAVTGNQTTPEMTPHLPITPEEIADACLGAAELVPPSCTFTCAIRTPAVRRWRFEYYRDVVERIRTRTTIILNITTGPGGRFAPDSDDPKIAGPGTTLTAARKPGRAYCAPQTRHLHPRSEHHEFRQGSRDQHAGNVRRMAAVIREARVNPRWSCSIPVTSRCVATSSTTARSTLDPVFDRHGVKYGFQPSPETVLYARGLFRPALSGQPSAPAAWPFPWWRNPISPAATSGWA